MVLDAAVGDLSLVNAISFASYASHQYLRVEHRLIVSSRTELIKQPQIGRYENGRIPRSRRLLTALRVWPIRGCRAVLRKLEGSRFDSELNSSRLVSLGTTGVCLTLFLMASPSTHAMGSKRRQLWTSSCSLTALCCEKIREIVSFAEHVSPRCPQQQSLLPIGCNLI